MKRLWIGLGILLALLVAGVWSMNRMEEVHSGIATELEQAAMVLREADWQRGDALLGSACKSWEDNRNLTAFMADHTTLDEIDATFAQMEVYRLCRKPVLCAAVCARLARQIEALEEGGHLNWWNLF